MALIRPPKKDSDFQASYWRIAHAELNYPENSDKAFGIVRLAGFDSAEARAEGKHLTCLYPPILLGSKDFPHDGQRVDLYAAVKLACPYFADALDDHVAVPVPEPAKPVDPVALDAATDEALAQDDDHLFSDTDDISEEEAVEAERDEARESLRVALEENAALKSREPEVRIVERVVEVSSPEAAPLKIIPDEIAAMMDPGDTFSPEVRRKLTERLNVELAELKNLRGLAGEDLKREAEIEKLLGLFARLGEI